MVQDKQKAAPPIKKIRVGGVSISLWENKNDEGQVFLKATFEKTYKDKQGEWATTDSYGAADLDLLDIALREARRYARIEYPASKKNAAE